MTRLSSRFLAGLALSLIALSSQAETKKAAPAPVAAPAAPATPALQAKDYEIIQPPGPSGQNGQIEVTEFFSYACPHCDRLEPKLEKWRSEQGKDVSFVRIPAIFQGGWDKLARLYITLNVMGLSDKLDGKVFDAVHRDHINMVDESARNSWLSKQGVDVKRFNDTWNSFGVETRMRRATQLAERYRVEGVPKLIVDGRFSPTDNGSTDEASGHTKMLEHASGLVAMIRAEKSKKK